jgi:hypothetical protein
MMAPLLGIENNGHSGRALQISRRGWLGGGPMEKRKIRILAAFRLAAVPALQKDDLGCEEHIGRIEHNVLAACCRLHLW